MKSRRRSMRHPPERHCNPSTRGSIRQTTGAAQPRLDPNQSVGYLIREIHRLQAKELHLRLAKYNITVAQWYYLRILWESDRITQRELSTKLGMIDGTTFAALRVMEGRGLIRREDDPVDQRQVFIRLTAKGRKLRAKLIPLGREANDVGLAHLTDAERKTFMALLQSVWGALERRRNS